MENLVETHRRLSQRRRIFFRMLSQRGMTKPKPNNILPVKQTFFGKNTNIRRATKAMVEVNKNISCSCNLSKGIKIIGMMLSSG
jgi:hypothetical protein